MSNDIQNASSQVTINGYDYYLDQVPEAEAPLVKTHKESVLKNMDLQTVYSNLDRTADLIKLAYVSVAGVSRGKLQARISGLQKKMLDLSKNCILTMDGLHRSSDEVLSYLSKMNKWLLKGNEKMAMSQLTKCSNLALNMAGRCEVLIKETDRLSNEAEQIKQEAIKEQGFQEELRRELETIIADAKALQKEALATQGQLVDAVKNVNLLYRDAQKRETDAGKREMWTGIFSAVSQAVASGLGTYNSIANTDIDNGASETEKKKLETEKSNKTKAEKKVKEIEDELKELEEEIKEINKDTTPLKDKKEQAKDQVKSCQKEVKEAEGDQKKQKSALKKLEDAKKSLSRAKMDIEDQKTKLGQVEKDIKTKNDNLEEERAALSALEASINSLSKSFAEMSKQASSERESISKEKMRVLEEKFELESQKRQAISDVVKYTEKIKSSQFQKNYAETAVYSLGLAIKAMAQIVTSLTQMNLFWNSMADYCKYLSESKFKEEISDLMENMDKEERIEYYTDRDFKILMIEDVAKWKALSVICEEYHQAATQTYKNVEENINAAPSLSEAGELVVIYANDVLTEAQSDLEAQSKRLHELEEQKESYRQAS